MFYVSQFPHPKDKSLCTSQFNLFIHTKYSATNQSTPPIIPFFLNQKFIFLLSATNFPAPHTNPSSDLLPPRLRLHFTLSSFLPFLFLRL